MTEVTATELPSRMKRWGCQLYKKTDGKIAKYVLTSKRHEFRSFLYVRESFERGAETNLDDLYASFFYHTGIQKVAHT